MLSRNSKARFEMRATKWGETERIKDSVSSLRRGMHFVETFIDVIALAVNPLHFSIGRVANRTRFLDCRSSLNEKQIGVNYDITENPILNAIQGDPPRAEKDVAEKDYARELYKLKIGRAICVTVILDGRLEQNFS